MAVDEQEQGETLLAFAGSVSELSAEELSHTSLQFPEVETGLAA